MSVCHKSDSNETSGKIFKEIESIRKDVEEIERQINNLEICELKSKQKKLEELLIQKTLALDRTETNGDHRIRERRRSAILYIQRCLSLMDSRLS